MFISLAFVILKKKNEGEHELCYTPNENFYQILIVDSVHFYVIVSQNKYCLNQNYAQSPTLCYKFLHSSFFYLGEVRWFDGAG